MVKDDGRPTGLPILENFNLVIFDEGEDYSLVDMDTGSKKKILKKDLTEKAIDELVKNHGWDRVNLSEVNE